MGNTSIVRWSTQASYITKLSEKMRDNYYTTNIEKMINGSGSSPSNDSLLLFRDNDQYMDFLKDWYFVRSLVDAFKNPIQEIIEKTPLVVTIDDQSVRYQEDWVNGKIKDSALKDEITSSLFDIIYWGRFFRLIYPSGDQGLKLAAIKDSTSLSFAYQFNNKIGYLVDPGSTAQFVVRSKAIGAAYAFRDIQTKAISEVDPVILAELNKFINVKDIPKDLADKVVALETRTPTSAFYSQAGLLFKMYMNEILSYFSSLRDTLKQNLLAITVSGQQKDTIESARLVQAVEAVVNQDSSVIYDQSVFTLIQQMIAKILNDTRVLPMVSEYSQVDLLKWNDRSADRDNLNNENQNLRTQVLSSLGIPEELFGAQSNRWEILSKSDRYLNTISTYLDMCTDIVKTTAQSLLLAKGYEISKDKIVFNYKNDTDIQSQLSRHKIEALADSTNLMGNMINNFQVLLGTGFFDVDKSINEFSTLTRDTGMPFAQSLRSNEDIISMLSGDGQ